MDFYKRLGIVCRAVPEGKVITYGQAALLCGYPKNARQVGYGLKKELAGDVPAYKVVNSQGVLSGAASFEHPAADAPGRRRDRNLYGQQSRSKELWMEKFPGRCRIFPGNISQEGDLVI